MSVTAVMKKLGLTGQVLPIAGGDVNQNYRINTQDGSFFLKYHPNVKGDFFHAEIHGLKELFDFVRVPKVYDFGEVATGAYLLMEWVEPGEGDHRQLAATLAELHRQSADDFGFPEDNYIGILPQVNAQTGSWVDFFLTCRLDVQVELAKINNVWNPQREQQYLRLKEFIWENWRDREFVPSLLHGDCWRGNVFFDQQGQPVFIDPAVSYGDREMDIAMSQLFGGFKAEFLETYLELAPLPTGWQERQPIYQLYYLLVHLNQFGESYGEQVDQLLSAY